MTKFGRSVLLAGLENMIWPTLIVVYVMFIFLKPSAMLRPDMVISIVYSSIPLGFIALAMALVLINGNFDLSVGQIAGLSAAVGGVAVLKGWIPTALTPFVPIGVGVLCGSLNGLLVGGMGLNAFLVTLGTFLAFDGLQLLVRHTVIYEFPEWYLLAGKFYPVSIGIFILVLLILYFVLQRTKFGYHYLAVGSTPAAAARMGLSIPIFHFCSFVFSGALSGAAGLFYCGYTGAYGPLLAEGTVFTALAAAVLGGISLRGGRGKIVNVFGGIILLGTISSGLTVLAITPYVRRVIFGSLVVVAIIIDFLRTRVRERVMREI